MYRPPRSIHGRTTALRAGTVLSALATATGSAFATDAEITASVELDDFGEVRGGIAETPNANAHLVGCYVELVTEAFGNGEGSTVEAESDLPMAAGFRSSSAAANATVLVTFSALSRLVGPSPDADISRLDACQMGIRVARKVGVTATEAFDDTMISMVGGIIVTDNTEDGLITRDEVDWDVLAWTPSGHAYSADADVNRCENVAPVADSAADLALKDHHAEAVTVNGLALSAALDFLTGPAVEATPIADGVSLSGTGPNVAVISGRTDLERVKRLWGTHEGETRLTTIRIDGA